MPALSTGAIIGITVPLLLVSGTTLFLYVHFVRTGPAFSKAFKFFGINPPPKPTVVGFTAPGYETLRDCLKKGFEKGDDLGSQLAIYVRGELVADIATGFTDRTYETAYTQDTLQLVFSSSKFVTMSVVLHLVNTGRLDLTDPISKHWPKFGEGNKAHVTIGALLAHRAGVAYLDSQRVPTPEEMVDLDKLASKIAGQPHNFDGEDISAYHAVTRGWFVNEVVRRVVGKSLREIMYDEVMPLINKDNTTGIPYEFHFGIPDEPLSLKQHVQSHLVKLDGFTFLEKMFFIVVPGSIIRKLGLYPVPKTLLDAYLHPETEQHKSLFKSGPDFTGREKEWPFSYNDPTLLRGQNPSFGCLTNAHSLAKLGELVRQSGKHDGGFLSRQVYDQGFAPMSRQTDRVINVDQQMLQNGLTIREDGFGIDEIVGEELAWTGWGGAGGSLIYYSDEIVFAYTPNFMHMQSVGDYRSWRMIGELMEILKKGEVEGGFTRTGSHIEH
ncbi:hypothetical protein HDU98_009580 [Podochytrium sp. JEL0797]|nr:hypothetical protein HDU98_009580 [Podochytrium sp. JEL0797]